MEIYLKKHDEIALKKDEQVTSNNNSKIEIETLHTFFTNVVRILNITVRQNNLDNTKDKKDHTENTINLHKIYPRIKFFQKQMKKGKHSLYLSKQYVIYP